MVKQEKINQAIRVFSFLMASFIDTSFSFPGGSMARKSVADCLGKLETSLSVELCRERIVDFCVCQVYVISGFDRDYLKRWNVSHSFGKKAMERFSKSTQQKRYYEDKWLNSKKVSRNDLAELIRDRKKHPLAGFIYPEYEEPTKKRLYGTEAGFMICTLSTFMWTPFSPSCSSCSFQERCRNLTLNRFPELFRIRVDEFSK